ncbi:uncharacterized protein PADG_11530 [Paracoccidioides brasiliensis Pb18]|uniref:Uncharacterized protein n=1 Tax=Paracoccidioides brasiliensis (strain Pb18) TaxID=502780 RepID=A0A0A0HVF7_PARBD|nr:uncharacterized protein PADG_11530 [Paracoccidioides brasiliensis Pb18]KGM92333.1 hypothetical protein PADG_11530 [Paracoccidioides brasiliensis Pb18]
MRCISVQADLSEPASVVNKILAKCLWWYEAAIEAAMTQQTWARELGDRATVDAVNPGPVIGDIFRESGKDFRNRMQGWRDNAPGSMIIVDEGFDGDGCGEAE